jgi:hypothetical protein
MIYLRCSWRDISQISSIPISWAGRIKEQEAARQALEDWLRKNKDQASLESYLKQGAAKPVIFQNVTLQKIQITIIKSELQRLVKVLGTCEPQAKMDFLKEIQKILPSAFTLLQETQDPELQELIRQVESLAGSEDSCKSRDSR